MTALKCRTKDLEIPEEAPFSYDKMGREQVATILTDIVTFYSQLGCVMSLNGAWGTGKTTFTKMWKAQLMLQGYKTLYYNAWTSDYLSDPLIALSSELTELCNEKGGMDEFISSVGKVTMATIGAGAKGVLKKFTGIDSDCIDAAIDETTEISKEFLAEYKSQKKAIEDFKKNLEEYVAYNASDKPIIFFIDELDRCNPNYAVSVLERVKHLFDVPNIIFVLAINKTQLCNAIQGYFGSTTMDANEYLKRFIDIEYNLPMNNIDKYCEYLYDEYSFDSFFNNEKRKECIRDNYEASYFKGMTKIMCKTIPINLRLLDRIFAYTRLALLQFPFNSYMFSSIYYMLCFWKITNNKLYDDICNKRLTVIELLKILENVFRIEIREQEKEGYAQPRISWVIAETLVCYDNTSLNGRWDSKKELQGTKTDDSKEILDFKLPTSIIDKDNLNEALTWYTNHSYDARGAGLGFIFKRINLLDNFALNR
jgi:hypothetical protein